MACGLSKPRVFRGLYLWTVEFRTVAPFPRRVAWQISRQRSSERKHTDVVWSLPLPLMCELFTEITRETTNALTSPGATSILPVPTMWNNANRGRNSWKARP
ncbi:hypothetical protein AVEN_178210-1 [Araneus ventricosus]|uniref:Uncharacterized protein n=1 Tax=Araneus ventricosus TaxID=182803 RepID=A0A4Y2H1N1_ARAVE|nr:hypothetical protein AVEN_178210-1 [Araneus ventricosus]